MVLEGGGGKCLLDMPLQFSIKLTYINRFLEPGTRVPQWRIQGGCVGGARPSHGLYLV